MSHTDRTLHAAGDRAILVDLADLNAVMAWHEHFSAQPLPGQREVIAAASTVLFTFASATATRNAWTNLARLSPTQRGSSAATAVTIPVIYDGADLQSLADSLRMSAEELINRHTSQRWLAAFGGFAPGFTYCVPLDREPTSGHNNAWRDIPRKDSPRTSVPAGSVALAGEFSAVYPSTSPGGWQLIGHTDQPMWDHNNPDDPALLHPGDEVRYEVARETVQGSNHTQPHRTPVEPAPITRPAASPHRPVFRVIDSGLLSVFQDSGRPGFGDVGVNSSGVADRASAWVANDTVGNPSSAAVVENIGGLHLEALTDVVVAVTGAAATIQVNSGSERPLAHPIGIRAGQTLSIKPVSQPGSGLRSYVAVRGGFHARSVLGSCSTDLLSGLGPDPLQVGDTLSCYWGDATTDTSPGGIRTSVAGGVNPKKTTDPTATTELRCVAGPRAEWFEPEELARFTQIEWVISGTSNRVGLRLNLPDDSVHQPMQRSRTDELPSEGMINGSVQVPPNGLPVVFLTDRPVTGGYPVIATVIDGDLDAAGQLAPGDVVRFVLVDPPTSAPPDPDPADARPPLSIRPALSSTDL